jgi:hypothetical protein
MTITLLEEQSAVLVPVIHGYNIGSRLLRVPQVPHSTYSSKTWLQITINKIIISNMSMGPQGWQLVLREEKRPIENIKIIKASTDIPVKAKTHSNSLQRLMPLVQQETMQSRLTSQ